MSYVVCRTSYDTCLVTHFLVSISPQTPNAPVPLSPTMIADPDSVITMRRVLFVKEFARDDLLTASDILNSSAIAALPVTIRKKGRIDNLATGFFLGNGQLELDWGGNQKIPVSPAMMVINDAGCSVGQMVYLARVSNCMIFLLSGESFGEDGC